MTHVFSIDVEDWYHGIEIPMDQWDGFESRIEASMDRLLDLMAQYDVTATCFILGVVAETHPNLVRRIHRSGHEIATHGYSHEKIYALSPDRFRRELRRSIDVLQALTGERIVGHRAPYFSITDASLWALDILADEGIRYDSSIQPVLNDRYGMPDADRHPTVLTLDDGSQILELPVATYPLSLPWTNVNIPCGGGAYFRIYPYALQRRFLRALDRRGEHIGLYLHPWEIDANHPRIPLPRRVAATHYWNLTSTYPKLRRLFQEFSFASYRDVFRDEVHGVPPRAALSST